MQLDDYFKAIGYKISGGEDVTDLKKNYPEGTRSIDSDTDYGSSTCYFIPETLQVIDVYVFDMMNRGENYRWIDSEFKNAHELDMEDPVFEDDKWAYTDSEEDILTKVNAILNNRKFNKEIVLTLELDDSMNVKELTKLAASKGMNVDDFIKYAVEKYIGEVNNGNFQKTV